MALSDLGELAVSRSTRSLKSDIDIRNSLSESDGEDNENEPISQNTQVFEIMDQLRNKYDLQ